MATKTREENEVIPAALLRELEAEGIEVRDASEFIGQLPKLNKDALIDVPFVITKMKNHGGTFGSFWSCEVVTMDGVQGFFTDGGTGIPPVLEAFVSVTGKHGGMLCRHGLRKSTYEATADRPAGTTYYIG